MDNIQKVINDGICCGCGACINACSQKALIYDEDKFGFIVPKIKGVLCVNCGRCLKVCPTINSSENRPIEAYAAMNRDEQIRFDSSSGGIFGLLAEHVICSLHGVVYGVKMDEKFHVFHTQVDNERDLESLLKSKYVQSYLGDCYTKVVQDLKEGKYVLFSGTPCQVAATRKIVPEGLKKNLFLVDVVCHGVPSQKFFNNYLDVLREHNGELKSYQFRTKRKVKNGMNCFFSFQKKNRKKIIKNWPEDTFNYLYMMSYVYRDSCYQCKFAKEERAGDITLADYWGWAKYHKEFPVGSTVSALLLNTEKGRTLFNAIRENLYCIQTDIENITRHNGCLVRPSEKPKERDEILKCWQEKGFQELDSEYKKRNKKLILKSVIMRQIPLPIMNRLANLITKMRSN